MSTDEARKQIIREIYDSKGAEAARIFVTGGTYSKDRFSVLLGHIAEWENTDRLKREEKIEKESRKAITRANIAIGISIISPIAAIAVAIYLG